MTTIPNIRLNDGNVMPKIGFGTFRLNGAVGVNVMTSALHNGYTMLDSAFNYENEGAVGKAVALSGIARSHLFVTSKLPGRHHGYDEALTTIQESLYRSSLEYYDLYLIHWPNPMNGKYIEAWKALVQAQKFGLVRSIGVSNFLPEHLDNIITATGVTPAVNQIELHPYWSQPKQIKYDQEHGIVTQAWSPIGRSSEMLHDQTISRIAKAHGKSISQIILRWEIQLGVTVIPKASSAKHQIENRSVFDFELTAAEMATISNLDKSNGRLKKEQNPASYQEL